MPPQPAASASLRKTTPASAWAAGLLLSGLALLWRQPALAAVQFNSASLQLSNSQGGFIPGVSTTDILSPSAQINLRDAGNGLRLGQVPLAVSPHTAALWKFDESPGSKLADDSSGNSLTLALKCFNPSSVSCSSPTFTTNLAIGGNSFGNGLVLGSGDGVSTMNASIPIAGTALDLTGQLTWEAWVEPTTNSGTALQAILETTPNQYGLYMNAAGNFVCRTNNSSDLVGTTRANTGTWYFVACVFQTGANGMQLYVNGALEAQETPGGALTDAGPVLTFGVNQNSLQTNQFNGTLAEARVLNSAESADQLATDFYSGTAHFSTAGSGGPYGAYVLDPTALSAPKLSDPTTAATTTVHSNLSLTSCSPNNYVQFAAQDTLGQLSLSPPYQVDVTTTPPPSHSPPGVAPGGLGLSSITWSWAADPCDNRYIVYTTTVQPSLALSTVTAASFTETGLSTNTAYSTRFLAANATGQSPLTSAATFFTLAAAPSGSQLVKVGSSTIDISWQPNGNPAYTPYVVSYGPVGGSTATLVVQGPEALVSNLAILTTYFIYVQASNGNSVTPSTLTAADVEFSTHTGDALQSGVAGPNDALVIRGALRTRSVSLTISPNTFLNSYTLAIVDASSFPCGAIAPPGISSAGVSLSIQPLEQPALPFTLSVTYNDAEVAGADPSRLELVRYDEAQGLCLPLQTLVDASAHTLTARVNHLSTFQIIQSSAPPTTLDHPRAYPNPLYLSRGQGYFTFRDLPPGTAVSVYTLRGELLHKTTADGSGFAQWEAVNPSGFKVASGIYLCLLESGSVKKILKLAVER